MSKVTIESGIPVPEDRVHGRFGVILSLKPGESVLFPRDSYVSYNSLSVSVSYYRRRYPRMGGLTIRKQDDGSVRIWLLPSENQSPQEAGSLGTEEA
jgi:hypothetical protein